MSAWPAPGPDPFLDEAAAQSYDDVMRGHAPGYIDPTHREYLRAVMLRTAAHHIRSNAGDLADGLDRAEVGDDLRDELLANVRSAQRTLAKAEALLTRKDPA